MPRTFNDRIVESEMRYTWNSQKVENTLWFHLLPDGDMTLDQVETLNEALLTWWNEQLQPLQTTNCQLREIFTRQAVQLDAITHTLVPGDPLFGTSSGDPLPGNATLTISFRSGVSGRSFRGRNYSIGMSEVAQSAGIADGTYVADIQSAYNALRVDVLDGADWEHVIYSQYTNGSLRPSGVFTPVNAALCVDNDMDSQRRRLNGRGQ